MVLSVSFSFVWKPPYAHLVGFGGFRAWDLPVTGGTVSYEVPLPTFEPVNLTIPEVPVINFLPVNVTIPTLGLPLPLWLQNTTSPAAATPPPRLTSSPPP